MHSRRLRFHPSCIALVVAAAAAAAPTALHAQDPPRRAAHETTHVLQQSASERAAQARTVLAELTQRPTPRGLTESERQQWDAQTEWLRSVERRIADVIETAADSRAEPAAAASPRTIRRDVDKATPQLAGAAGGDGDEEATGEEAAELLLTQLQEAVQHESRRFQTMSNAQKARHEMAMNIIRNLK